METETPKQAPPPRVARAARPSDSPAAAPSSVPSEVASVISQMKAEEANAAPMPIDDGPDPLTYYRQNGPGTFTSSRGIVLRIHAFSWELATRVQRNLLKQRPEPPRTYNKDDDKYTTDEKDPDYLRAMSEYVDKVGYLAFASRVSLGTEFLSAPDGVFPPDDDGWIDYICNPNLFGDCIPEICRENPGRYVDWLRFYAFGEGDIQAIYVLLEEASGVIKEQAVNEAVRSFRDLD